MRLAVRAILLLTMHTKKLQQPETVNELIELFVKSEPMFLDGQYGKIVIIEREKPKYEGIKWHICLDTPLMMDNYPDLGSTEKILLDE